MKFPLIYLNKLSEEFCPDYPNIKNCNPHERLWAIESTLEGTKQANEECHKMIQILRKRLGLTNNQILEIWEKEIRDKND